MPLFDVFMFLWSDVVQAWSLAMVGHSLARDEAQRVRPVENGALLTVPAGTLTTAQANAVVVTWANPNPESLEAECGA